MKTLLLTAGLLLSGTVHASDTLWQRAVALSAYNRDAVPGDWVERQEIFDLEGESHLVLRTHVGFSQTHSKIDVTLIEATSNGIDLTSELLETFEDRKPEFTLKPQYNPFQPSEQKNVSAKPEGRTRREGETVLVAYDYTHRTDDGRWRGVAWIDDVTGTPVELNARLIGLPVMDDKDQIREVVLNVTFRTGEEREWHIAKVTLFKRAILNNFPYADFHATIETAIILDDYWKIRFR